MGKTNRCSLYEYYLNKYEIMSSENLECNKDGNLKFTKETFSDEGSLNALL